MFRHPTFQPLVDPDEILGERLILAQDAAVCHRAGDRGRKHALEIRLGHEVEHAGVHRLEDLRHAGLLAENDDRQQRIHGVQAPKDLDTVHVRHMEIGDDGVQLWRGGHPKSLGAALRNEHRPSLVFEERLDCVQG